VGPRKPRHGPMSSTGHGETRRNKTEEKRTGLEQLAKLVSEVKEPETEKEGRRVREAASGVPTQEIGYHYMWNPGRLGKGKGSTSTGLLG